jgi:adenylate cyclase
MSQTRRLTAILFADIEGYTAIMHNDEILASTIAAKFRKHLEEQVALHQGHVQEWNGDGALCLFDSAVAAVQAAIAVQQEMRQQPVVPLRIGIHAGDVLQREGKIYGDVVNIASRIESFAQSGGVFISEKIYDEIRNQHDIRAVSLGLYRLKNITEPMQIFAISGEGLLVPQRKRMMGKGSRVKGLKVPLLWVTAFVLIVIATLVYYGNLNRGNAVPASIAVLPFVDMSATKDQEYFGDGLSEELLNRLSNVKGLKVIARMSSFSFKGSNESIPVIGEKLGVTHILQGSVRKSENKIRVTAQLTKVTDGTQIWSETYDRMLDDIFKIQDDIALTVVNRLQATLVKPDELSGTQTNPQAYNLKLQGDYFVGKGTTANLMKAREFYEKALLLDSTDARTWASLSQTNLRLTEDESDKEAGINKTRKLAEKAIALNPNITNGYLARGRIRQSYDWDWKGADADYEKAYAINPDDAAVLHRKASLKKTLGDFEAAIELYKYAIELDPVNARLRNSFGLTLMNANQFPAARQQLKKTLELDPGFGVSHFLLSGIYLVEGKLDSSRIQWELEPEEEWRLSAQALYQQVVGPKAISDSLLNELINQFSDVCSFQIAAIYSVGNNTERAFYWLEQAYLKRDAGLAEIIGNPFLKNLEGDPRYATFLEKMGLPVKK